MLPSATYNPDLCYKAWRSEILCQVCLLCLSCCYAFPVRLTEEEKEWVDVEREREVRRKEAERARQELETRKRIEARLLAKREAESKARRESTENGA